MKKTYIIAEIAQGFEGNPWLCKKYVDLAKKSGADAVKFQIFLSDELATKDYAYYDLFRGLEIDPRIWADIIMYANNIGIDFLSDIYGTETLKWISKTMIKGIKIHSTDIMNYPLLKAVKATGIKIYLAVGGSHQDEIAKALDLIGSENVVLLSGFQAEPNILEDLELDKIGQLSSSFNIPVGYADHVDPTSSLSVALPAIAVMKGASVIEKHLTIDRANLQLEDYVSALNPDEFLQMVKLVRDVEQLPVTNAYLLSSREQDYRTRTKRSIVLKEDLLNGAVLKAEQLQLLRTGVKGDFYDMNVVVGKSINKLMKSGDILKKEDLI